MIDDRSNEQIVKEIQAGQNVEANILQLLKKNHGAIYSCCKKYQGINVLADMDDLQQEAAIALYHAVELYQEDGGANFLSYYHFWLHRYLSLFTWQCEPINCKGYNSHIYKYKGFLRDFYMRVGRQPNDNEAMLYLQVNRATLKKIKENIDRKKVLSLDYVYDNGDTDEGNTLEPGATDPGIEEAEHRAQVEQLRATEEKILNDLPKDEADAIRERYFYPADATEEERKELKKLYLRGMAHIRKNRKAIAELRGFVDWTDSKSYKVGLSSWRHGLSVDNLAIKRLLLENDLKELAELLEA